MLCAAMKRRITIIDGHPDPERARFVHALADAYADGAVAGGHDIRRIEVAQLNFPVLRSRKQWVDEPLPPLLEEPQAAIGWADHIVIFYPLWMGDIPALLKAFLEQVLRPGFALIDGARPKKLLTGKSAHVVVTMGMPGFFYATFYRAHSLKSLERNVLKMTGIKPVRHTIIGGVGESAATREGWLEELASAGESAH
jgi:putative NADPH-quinone reductase